MSCETNSRYYPRALSQEGEGEENSKDQTLLERLKSCLPWTGKAGEGLLGQGLAKQVGNVTECALLGFLVELGK